ncbi:MAG: hypothetical protein WBK91_02490 [Alphaproteobacteria bacterium]
MPKNIGAVVTIPSHARCPIHITDGANAIGVIPTTTNIITGIIMGITIPVTHALSCSAPYTGIRPS